MLLFHFFILFFLSTSGFLPQGYKELHSFVYRKSNFNGVYVHQVHYESFLLSLLSWELRENTQHGDSNEIKVASHLRVSLIHSTIFFNYRRKWHKIVEMLGYIRQRRLKGSFETLYISFLFCFIFFFEVKSCDRTFPLDFLSLPYYNNYVSQCSVFISFFFL